MRKTKVPFTSSGLTLLEVTIGIFILTVGVLSFIGVFSSIGKAVKVSRSRTLAANLAQEKIEYLKNISYHRLLVTTDAATATGTYGSLQYDPGYYPPEYITVGQIKYIRGVLIQKMAESGGSLVARNWYDQDTGLKLITSYVVWDEGTEERLLTINNLRDDPNRLKMDASFSGTVRTGGTAIQNAQVMVLQNPAWKASTSASGTYSITVSSGSYELRASKRGYFPVTVTSTVASNTNQPNVDFNLPAMGYGTVIGTAYFSSHLVLADICAAVNGDDSLEYVELYNPSESTFTISGVFDIDFVLTAGNVVTNLNPAASTAYVNNTVYPHHFFLLASTNVINGVAADAYYSDASHSTVVPANRIPTQQSGGVRIVSGVVNIDAIGWGRSGGSPWGPSIAREGTGYRFSNAAAHSGFDVDQTLERVAYSTSTDVLMSINPVGAHATQGNAFDSDSNSADWVFHNDATNNIPNNTSTIEHPRTGTPAAGALVFVDDGLSASSVASSTGAYAVTMVATGTWSTLISSSGYAYSAENNIAMTNNAVINQGIVILNSSSTYGYVTGRVVTSANVPINIVPIETSGGSDTTDPNGIYRMRLTVGTFTIVANSDNYLSQYTVGQATGVVVNAGMATVAPDIILYQGGKIRGFITTNGTDPLPGVPVIATESVSGAQIGSAITDSQGYYNFADLPVDTYVLTPQLETGESPNPGSITITVINNSTVFAGTFTVSNAFGSIQGTVKKGTALITSGVLVMAVVSPNVIGANPPTNNASLRSGSVVYYSNASDGEGTYSLAVRAGTYNVYGWYTTYSGNSPTVSQTPAQTVTVAAGGTGTLNLTW